MLSEARLGSSVSPLLAGVAASSSSDDHRIAHIELQSPEHQQGVINSSASRSPCVKAWIRAWALFEKTTGLATILPRVINIDKALPSSTSPARPSRADSVLVNLVRELRGLRLFKILVMRPLLQ